MNSINSSRRAKLAKTPCLSSFFCGYPTTTRRVAKKVCPGLLLLSPTMTSLSDASLTRSRTARIGTIPLSSFLRMMNNMVRTIESLLGVPPMNANDSRAAVMAPLFSGPGQQPPFTADYRNRDNGLIYQVNAEEWKEGEALNFSRADAVDTALLNKFLWQDRMGNVPMPAPRHDISPQSDPAKKQRKDLD